MDSDSPLSAVSPDHPKDENYDDSPVLLKKPYLPNLTTSRSSAFVEMDVDNNCDSTMNANSNPAVNSLQNKLINTNWKSLPPLSSISSSSTLNNARFAVLEARRLLQSVHPQSNRISSP